MFFSYELILWLLISYPVFPMKFGITKLPHIKTGYGENRPTAEKIDQRRF